MNPFALAALVTATLFGLALFAGVCAHAVDAVLAAPQRALFTAVVYVAGFCTAIAFFALRT